MTLCFVLWRFDFGVLTFYFHILSFLFCVLCTMLFILNGAIHEVEKRYRRKDGRKRSCKYFNALIHCTCNVSEAQGGGVPVSLFP